MERLLKLIQDMTVLYEDFAKFQEEKRVVLTFLQSDRLEEIARREQPFALKVRGFDQRRKALTKELGFGDVTLGTVVSEIKFANDAEELAVKEGYAKLREAVSRFADVIGKNAEMAGKYVECFTEEYGETLGSGSGKNIDVIS
nr:flagellar protein FlgN [Oscillospiraceae bacterium]